MQAEDLLESRFDRLQAFLTANGASTFAKLLYNIPQLRRATLSPELTMVIAPTDDRLQELSNQVQKPLAELFDTDAGRDLLANHVSILPTQKVYPMFTAVNGVTYGSGPDDLTALNVTASAIIDRVVVLVARAVIGTLPQITKSGRRFEPGAFAGMTRDAFRAMINNGQLRGKDLIALCNSDPYVNANFCRSRDASGRTIFHYLIKEEFGIDVPVGEDARTRYIELHQEAEFRLFPTTGTLLDRGPTFDPRTVRQGGRRDIRITQPYINELYERTYPGRMAVKGPVDETKITNLSIDMIIHSIWMHPIDLHLVVSVYESRAGSYRVLVARAVRHPLGVYISDPVNGSSKGERFNLETDPDRHNPMVTCGDIGPTEVPIKTKIIHYTRPYPETLPFLYDRRIRTYNLDELDSILEDIYRLFYSGSKAIQYVNDQSENPRSIVDIIGRPRSFHREQVEIAIRSSLCSFQLTQSLLTDEIVEPEIDIWIRGALQVRISERFHLAYRTMPKATLAVILDLLLIFAGAVVIKEATVFKPTFFTMQ